MIFKNLFLLSSWLSSFFEFNFLNDKGLRLGIHHYLAALNKLRINPPAIGCTASCERSSQSCLGSLLFLWSQSKSSSPRLFRRGIFACKIHPLFQRRLRREGGSLIWELLIRQLRVLFFTIHMVFVSRCKVLVKWSFIGKLGIFGM